MVLTTFIRFHSGKLTYGKLQSLVGKSTISMAIFNSYMKNRTIDLNHRSKSLIDG